MFCIIQHQAKCAFAVVLSCMTGSLVFAQTNGAPHDLVSFFANQGCAIGPSTREAAVSAGFTPEAINELTKEARADGATVQTGEWLVLSPLICQLLPPTITSEIRLTDPEVIRAISEIDVYAATGDPGCFLDGSLIYNDVQVTRGWDSDKANIEYLRFLGASFLSGDLAFYSDSPLRTPPGPVVTTGECADIPLMPEIKPNHALMIKHFASLVTTSAAKTLCENGAGALMLEWNNAASDLTDDKVTNAWIGFEIQLIAMGAGWFEGASATNKGTPRPPLCHYD